MGTWPLAADGTVLLHAPEGSTTTYRSTNWGNSWSAVNGLAVRDARPVADPLNQDKFYVYAPTTGRLWISTDAGQTFAQAASVAPGGSSLIRSAPGREGDIWLAARDQGLLRSTNGGQSFSAIAGVSHARAVGFGRAAEADGYPTAYIWGTVDGTRGLYRSTDQGTTWCE